MNICVIGTGYVGLVSGTCFSDVGNNVTCIDLDESKIENLKKGIIPIYEPGLKEMVLKNIDANRLHFSTNLAEGMKDAEVVIIAVGTPQAPSGEANLEYVENVAVSIGENLNGYKVIVTKSTVPVGTGQRVKNIVKEYSHGKFEFDVASNPEFLREGSAVYDTMNMDRAVIGVESQRAEEVLTKLHEPFNTEIVVTNVETSEMIKYAANAFLATKISFINEIANLSEHFGADVKKVAEGIGLDKRIGKHFLQAGIGYGGSCFPKDTSALIHIGREVGEDLSILKAVENVNKQQRMKIADKVNEVYPDLEGKRLAVLGLAFKPNTDDMRYAPSVDLIPYFKNKGAEVIAFDPVAYENAAKEIEGLNYTTDLYETVKDSDAVIILTEWDEVKKMDLNKVKKLLNHPVIIDGRNIFELDDMKQLGFYYASIGRPTVK
jgi:UDPglucose 6-dehydrogenase